MKWLYLFGIVLILFWVVGFVFQYIISPLIHLALIVGLGLIVWNYFQDSRNRRAI